VFKASLRAILEGLMTFDDFRIKLNEKAHRGPERFLSRVRFPCYPRGTALVGASQLHGEVLRTSTRRTASRREGLKGLLNFE